MNNTEITIVFQMLALYVLVSVIFTVLFAMAYSPSRSFSSSLLRGAGAAHILMTLAAAAIVAALRWGQAGFVTVAVGVLVAGVVPFWRGVPRTEAAVTTDG